MGNCNLLHRVKQLFEPSNLFPPVFLHSLVLPADPMSITVDFPYQSARLLDCSHRNPVSPCAFRMKCLLAAMKLAFYAPAFWLFADMAYCVRFSLIYVCKSFDVAFGLIEEKLVVPFQTACVDKDVESLGQSAGCLCNLDVCRRDRLLQS